MSQKTIRGIRAFNRFYTDLLGLLNKHLLDSDYSLAEVRVMYEIQANKDAQASHIMAAMDIDKSYLSRILKRLEKDGLIVRKASKEDGRAIVLSFTGKGEQLFRELTKATEEQISELIADLNSAKQQELLMHMQAIEEILANNDK
jgi:DNA-binding MarR family transcriptional regulator